MYPLGIPVSVAPEILFDSSSRVKSPTRNYSYYLFESMTQVIKFLLFFMGILVTRLVHPNGSGNQLIAWAKSLRPTSNSSPRTRIWDLAQFRACRCRTYRHWIPVMFIGYPTRPLGFFITSSMWIKVAERIHVRCHARRMDPGVLPSWFRKI